jgi:hypothetical protein
MTVNPAVRAVTVNAGHMDRHSPADHSRPLAEVRKASWPDGATAGLLLVAAVCLCVSTALYQVAGPHHVFAEEIAITSR